MNNSGIYVIKNSVNKLVYVGSSVNTHRRFIQHVGSLKRKEHRNAKLQEFYNKNGNVFTFEILELCGSEKFNELENKYMELFSSIEDGFNMYPTINNPNFKNKCSELTKLAMTERVRKIIGDTHRGKIESEETKLKKSNSHKGEKNINFGKPRSEETKRKISEVKKRNFLLKKQSIL
jgi:group I intron endonuclease